MQPPHRPVAAFVLSAISLLSVPALASSDPAVAPGRGGPAGVASGQQEPDSNANGETKRSAWDVLRFRKAPKGENTAPREEAQGAASESESGSAALEYALPRNLAKAGQRLRSGAAGADPVVRTFLDKIGRGEANSADLNAFATYLAKKGLVQDALLFQEEAIRIDRNNPTLWLNAGTLQRDLGRRGAAMTSYRRVLSLDPNNALAHYNVGSLLDADGRYDGAVEEYRTALTLDPTLADPVKNPQIVNNERLMVVSLLLYQRRAGSLGLPLVPVKDSSARTGASEGQH